MKSILYFALGSPRLIKICIIVLFIAATVLLLCWTPQAKAAFRSIGFVAQVLPTVSIKPLQWFTAMPQRREISYPLDDGGIGIADLYNPASGGKHSAVLFFLGVNPAGKDDERVVNLGDALARTGVVVMIPWSDRMAQRRITEQEAGDLVRGFEHLRSLDMVDDNKVGMAGFCVGASLMMVAAQDERIRDDVKVVNSFAGYYEAEDLIASVVAARRFYGEDSGPWEPDKLSVQVVRTHLLESIDDPVERATLAETIENNAPAPSNLSSDARLVYDILNAPDLETAHRLIDFLPSDSLETLRRISPSTNIDGMKAKALVMHDRQDNLVPSEESRRLVDALQSRGDVHYTEFSFFEHLDPSTRVGNLELAREGVKLFLHIYKIMRELD
jgi:dienelactone hydrolase